MNLPGRIISNIFYFDVIRSVSNKGKKMIWQIKVGLCDPTIQPNDSNIGLIDIKPEYFISSEPIPYYAWIKVDSGFVDGVTKKSAYTIVKVGKNLGRKNATNAFQQAIKEAHSKYVNYEKKNSMQVYGGKPLVLPMLADTIKKSSVKPPCYVQRKYDGTRCIFTWSDEGVIAYSRTAEIYRLDHVKKELMPILKANPNLYIDGEMYKHGMPLQEISGIVRGESGDQSIVDYVVFDSFIAVNGNVNNDKFDIRYNRVYKLFTENRFNHTILADIFIVDNETELNEHYNKFLNEGYEGAIGRMNEVYLPSKKGIRSPYLAKLKPELDHEFEVVDFTLSTEGKMDKAVILTCQTSTGIKFNVNPALPIDRRIEIGKKYSKIVNGKRWFDIHVKGHMLIVLFDAYSTDGVPLRLRTKLIFRKGDHHYSI